jgi:NADPH2:quinone reductase
MKKIILKKFGSSDELTLADVTLPELKDDEVEISLKASGVNFADIKIRRGYYANNPNAKSTFGSEASGIVTKTGRDAHKFAVGEKVFVITHLGGCYAEQIHVPEYCVFRLPVFMSFEEGAAFCNVAQTAYHVLRNVLRVSAGDAVLIHAAAGGVGSVAVQIAKLLGAMAIGLVSTQEKMSIAKVFGCDAVLGYDESDLADKIKSLTNGTGVKFILDGNGGERFEENFSWLAIRGELVLYGNSAGDPPPIHPYRLVFPSQRVTGFSMFSVTQQADVFVKSFDEIFKWIESGQLKIHIGHKFPLADAAAAHALMESRQSIGKIVLIP